MDRIIVFKNTDGSCGIIFPTPEEVFRPEVEAAEAKKRTAENFAHVDEELKRAQATVNRRTKALADFDELPVPEDEEGLAAHTEERKSLVAALDDAQQHVAEVSFEHSKVANEKQFADALPEKMSEADITARLELIAENDVPVGLQWRITTSDKLPTDRMHRHAWTDDFDTETVDIDEVKKGNMLNAVPDEVSAFNAKLALLDAGLWVALRGALGLDQRFLLHLDELEIWRRDSEFVQGVAQTLNLTDEQVDALFVNAGKMKPA